MTAILEQAISLAACVAVVLVASRMTSQGPGASLWLGGPAILAIMLALPWFLPRSAGLVGGRAYVTAAATYVSALAPYAAASLLLVSFVQGLFEGTVAGVLALFAPGGLGVRESWVVFDQVGAGGKQMLGMLVLARLLILASEVLLTLAALGMTGRFSPEPAADAGADR